MNPSEPRRRDSRRLIGRTLPVLAPLLVLMLGLVGWIAVTRADPSSPDPTAARVSLDDPGAGNTSAVTSADGTTATSSPTPTRTTSPTPTRTTSPTPTRTTSPTPTRTTSPTPTRTTSPTPTSTKSPTPTSTKSPTPTRTPTPTGGNGTVPGFRKAEAEVLRLVNVERSKVGCRPLRGNRNLALAARRHSQDMADHNYFDHASQDGRNFTDRTKAAGYQGFASAENIAAGSDTPAKTMGQWMNSEGHRTAILNCDYKDLGVGLGKGGSYRYYWTQDFGMGK
jgi:uncharacterized protein YkwD